MQTPYQQYIQLIQIIADDFAEKGYTGVNESDIKKHYSVDDLFEVSGLYLMTLSPGDRVEYLINSDDIFTVADKVSLYMSKPVSFFDNEKVSKIQNRKDSILNTIFTSLVSQTLFSVIRDINDNISFGLDSRDFYFQHSESQPARQSI